MPRYGIATLLESHPSGYEFKTDNTPLHLTHVDSFAIDLEADALVTKLSERLTDFPAFSVRATHDQMLGQNNDIHVTILELNDQLKNLHAAIMQVLSEERAILKNPHFHNEGFNPHVSVYGSRRVEPGDQIRIKDISLATRLTEDDNPTHKILATIALR